MIPRDWPEKALAGGAFLLLVPVILLLVALEVRYGGAMPLAFPAAVLLVYGALCLVDLPAAFLLLLVVTPFSVQQVFGGSGLQIPTEPMLFVGLVAWFLRSLARGHHVIPQPAFLAALFLALCSCLVSIIDTDFRFAGLKATLNVSWYAFYGIFVLNNFGENKRLTAIVHAWIWPSLIIVAWSALNVLSGHYNRWAGYFWGEPFFYDHGTFSAYLSFTCALCLALTLELDHPVRYFFLAVAAATGGQVVLSLTRGAWLGLLGLVPFMALAYGRRLVRPANLSILVGAASLVTLLIIATGTERDIQKHSGTITKVGYQSNVERMGRWYAGYEMFLSDPIDGIGFGAYQDYYLNYRRLALATDQSRQRMGIHSEYFRVMAETGILGLLAGALALGVLVRIAFRAIKGSTEPLRRGVAVGMAGGLLTYLIHAVVNNYLEYDKAAIPVWTAIGVLAAIERTNSRKA